MKSERLVYELCQTAAVFGRHSDVRLVFEGSQPMTDGNVITLPSIPQGISFSHEEVMVFRGYLDHEAGHVRHTDMECFQNFAKVHGPVGQTILNCLEDIWLEDKVMAEYPGSRKNLTQAWSAFAKLEEEPTLWDKVTLQSVSACITSYGRKDYGGSKNAEFVASMPDKWKRLGELWCDQARANKDTKANANLALEIMKLLEENKDESPEQMPEELDFDPEGDELDGKPVPKEEKLSSPSKGKKGKGKGKEGEEEGVSSDFIKEMKEWIESKVPSKFSQDKGENSNIYRVYSTRHDAVLVRDKAPLEESPVQERMSNGTASDYEALRFSVSSSVNVMKSQLRRALLARERRDWDFGKEIGKLDSKRLVAGSLGAANVYKTRKDRLEHNTAVLVLVDLSGSMGGKKIETACLSAIALAECLEGTPISYEIAGFSNYGNYEYPEGGYFERYEALKIHRFKRFEESLSAARGAVASIKDAAGGNNADRDAIVWAFNSLYSRQEARKVLMVLSDGQPANSSYGCRPNLVAKAKYAVDEGVKNGVECVGIGIEDTSVKQIYPKAVHIKKVEDLSGAVFNQLSNILLGKVR